MHSVKDREDGLPGDVLAVRIGFVPKHIYLLTNGLLHKESSLIFSAAINCWPKHRLTFEKCKLWKKNAPLVYVILYSSAREFR